ncbi:MAG: CRTAC1 family protein [Bryobacteraceae bacterium]
MSRPLAAFALCLLLAAAEPAARIPGVWYEDVAESWGFLQSNTFGGNDKKIYILESTGTGAAIFDFNGDGWDDVFLVNGSTLDAKPGREPIAQLYRNDQGRFVDVAREAGLTRTGWGQAACVADVQNNGHPDLFVTYYGRNVLYHNNGDGTFRDTTVQAGLADERTRWGAGCAFVDFDRDGFVDLFIANYVDFDPAKTPGPGEAPDCIWKGLAVFCGPRGLPHARPVFYRNNGDGTFTDVTAKARILPATPCYGLGVAAADFDNDGWPDIYVACDMTPSLFYQNRGDGTFQERGVEAGVAYNFNGQLQAGMGIGVADYDRNGFLDIVKTNFSGDLPSLYNNEDGRFFSDVSQQAKLARHQYVGWGAAFLDADEDGWPDIVLANGHVYPEVEGSPTGERYRYPTLLYGNRRDGRFADWTAQAGPAFEPARPARGLAIGDLDGDGHPEIVIVNMGERPSVLRNAGARRNAVLIALEGTRSNRSAIGARVTVETAGGRQIQEVASGGSYYSHNSFRLHFGLDGAESIEGLAIRWPSGAEQSWTGLPINRIIRIREGADPSIAPFPKPRQ